jgi:hypothetical protein
MTKTEKFLLGLTALLLLVCAYSVIAVFPTDWDFLCYHLPAALRNFHLTTFNPGHRLTEVIAGFPPVPHLVEGFLIYSTGKVKAANAIGFLSLGVLLLFFYSATRSSKKTMWALFLLLSVPLVTVHLTSPFVDLWSSVWMGLAVYYGILILRNPFRWSTSLLFGLFSFIASMSKMQNWPILGSLGIFMLVVWVWRLWVELKQVTPVSRDEIVSHRKMGLLLIVVGMLVVIWPIRNWILYHNPTHPWAPPLIKRFVPPEQYMIVTDVQSKNVLDSTPKYLWNTPQSFKFLVSVFELGRLANPKLHYRHDMWNGGPEFIHHRMGGWGIWLVGFLIFWIFRWARRVGRESRTTLLAMGFLFISVSVIPQSHELRYWLFFPIALILCLVDFDFDFLKGHQRSASVLFLITLLSVFGNIKLRPQNVYDVAPPAAQEFWRQADTDKTYDINSPPNEIFWSGPDFNTFKINAPEYE